MFQFPDSKYTNQPKFSTMPVNNIRINSSAFKNGGSCKNTHMREVANMLREQGQGKDKILAHINKDEARELQMMHGSSGINPHTGLPQFGKHRLGKFFKKALPILGSVGGFLVGGPAGAMAGGAIGGGLSGRRDGSGHRNFISNMLRGAGQGAMIGAGGHFLGGGTGGLFGGAGGGLGMPPGISGPVVPGAQTTSGGGGGGLLGGLGGLGDSLGGLLGDAKGMLGNLGISPIEALLGGTAIMGLSKGKQKPAPKEGQEQIPDFMRPKPDNFKPKSKFVDRNYVPAPEGYRSGIDPQHFYMQPEEEQEEYAHGGYFEGGGYLDGGSGGQDDDIHAKLSPGEYVIDADVVSALGDGNNKAGAKKLDIMRVNIRKHKRKAKPNAIPPKAKKPEQYFSNYVRR